MQAWQIYFQLKSTHLEKPKQFSSKKKNQKRKQNFSVLSLSNILLQYLEIFTNEA